MSTNNGNKHTRILRRRKQKIDRRLMRKQWEEQEQPMLRGSNIHYEMVARNGAINCGGIGVFHQTVKKIGLIEEIDAKVELLKMHVPYHESDHVLNIAYNILVCGMRLEDIEMRRQDEIFPEAMIDIDGAIGLVKPHAVKVCLRGDTDFSLTDNFDRWWRHEVVLVIVWQWLQPSTKPGVSPPVS